MAEKVETRISPDWAETVENRGEREVEKEKERERPEKTGQGQDKDNRQVGRQTDGPTATARQRGEAGEADRQAADRGRTEPDKIGWTGQTFF